jgi:hypothetical protein
MKTAQRNAMLAISALLLVACSGGSRQVKPDPGATSVAPEAVRTAPAPVQPVCCESYGFGAGMVECCFVFEWTKPEACKVPPGFVGGGKRIVSNNRCPAST